MALTGAFAPGVRGLALAAARPSSSTSRRLRRSRQSVVRAPDAPPFPARPAADRYGLHEHLGLQTRHPAAVSSTDHRRAYAPFHWNPAREQNLRRLTAGGPNRAINQKLNPNRR